MTRTLKFTSNDMVRLENNQGYEFVEDKVKLKQDVELMATSDTRASTSLGCSLDKVVGKDTMKHTDSFSVYPSVFDFQMRLRLGLSRLRGNQKAYQYGDRTPGELMFDFTPARVWFDDLDQRNLNWSVQIFTVEGGPPLTISGSSGGN